MASTTERGQWRIVRWRRTGRALTALQDGRAHDALQELNHPGAVDDERAEVLSAVATVMSTQTLFNAASCVELLERYRDSRLGRETFAVATNALEPVLRYVPGASPELVAHVAQLTDRLMQAAGPLPWGHYNLAVYAMQIGRFDLASRYLAAGAAAPADGWPPALLGAACAVVLGDPDALVRWLSSSDTAGYFAGDTRFFGCVARVFDHLRGDHPVRAGEFGDALTEPDGPLTRWMLQLSALKSVLRAAIHGGPTPIRQRALDGCVWGQWLRGRLHYAEGTAAAVLSDNAPEHGQPALIWQRLGSAQDLLPLLPVEAARALPPQLVDFGARFTDGAAWGRLADLRIALSERSSKVEAASDMASGFCPWWQAGGCLQRVADREKEVERGYLEGRLALRNGRTDAAYEWFAHARTGFAGQGMVAYLIRMRYEPLLAYWEGVAFAHAGQAEKATELLQRCAHGVKGCEARAQLGLLSVAAGEYAEAAKLLETIPEPRPASADYLAALLAARSGDVHETAHLLDGFADRDAVAGVYLAASHRLLGRLHEVDGEITEAARRYRQALTHRPEDPFAAARLARVRLRQRYDGAEMPPEPLLAGDLRELAGVSWGAPLLLIRDCLDGVSGESPQALLDRVPADPALRLLTARCAIETCDDTVAVVEALRKWTAEGEPDPRLLRAAHAARASCLIRDFCLADADDQLGSELVTLEAELRSIADDPVLAFWAETARLLSHPELAAHASPLPAMEDHDRSAAVKLFSGLLSLFATDPQQRLLGARHARSALEAEPVPHASAQAAARCLIADTLGEDQEFLASYAEIEQHPDALPGTPVTGYLTATEARLRNGNLDEVIDGYLPDELADLADPGVRRAMAIAYARRAARSADRDIRRSLRDIEQARALLQEAV